MSDVVNVIDWSARLEQDGLLERGGDGILRTSRRWHAAMARSALRLYQSGAELVDMRTPIAATLVEFYEDETSSALTDAVRAMLMVAMSELVALTSPPTR